MTFVLFAAAAVIWSLLALLWSILPRRRRGRVPLLAMTWLAAGAAAASAATDFYSLQLGRRAQGSDLSIRIVPHEAWWELQYEGGGISLVTANELHVPARTRVALSWVDLPPPWIDGAICGALPDTRCTLVATDAPEHEARFFRLWPPACRRLRIVADAKPEFERWLRNEATAARAADPRAPLFTSAGCSYCHVIRGVAASPSSVAPDLTHFAARRTISGTDLPNRHGFLAGWVVNSRALKPRSGMPPNRLDPAVLHTLVSYLESLR